MQKRNRLLITFIALTLVAAACSESVPNTAAGTATPVESSTPNVEATVQDVPADAPAGETENPQGDDTEPEQDTDGAADTEGMGDSIIERHSGEAWFMGTIPSVPLEADASLEPIRIGMINQEDTPLGSFPEMRFAADAAINWINAELGGVDGRPLELVWCISPFSAEQSQACAQELVQEEVVALVGGINVMAQSALPVLEQNGLAIIGGIPAGLAEQRSDLVFSFSGGSVGGMAAMLEHAAENGAKKAVIAHGDFDAFQVSADYARQVGEYLGMEVKLVKFPVIATDFLPVLTQAADFEADAVIVAVADASCVPVMQTFRDLGIDGQLYLVGACATEPIMGAADGANSGVIFSAEGPSGAVSLEGTIYDEVTNEYNNGPAKAAGTVGFRGMMNLYSLLVDLGADGISPASLIELIRAADGRDSFWGHEYTCDGEQVPGLPALCAPQQTLFTMEASGEVEFITDWIDTAELFAAAAVG